jgi:hypothetical protein
MGSCSAREQVPIVEIGVVQEVFFTDIEIEIFARQCVRFRLTSEQTPVDCETASPERMVRFHCTTVIDLVPMMIRKTVFALGHHWGKDAVSGLFLPG